MKWPFLVKICMRERSFPRSQTTNLPLFRITATFLGYHNWPSSLPGIPNWNLNVPVFSNTWKRKIQTLLAEQMVSYIHKAVSKNPNQTVCKWAQTTLRAKHNDNVQERVLVIMRTRSHTQVTSGCSQQLVQYMKEHRSLLFPYLAVYLTVASMQHLYETLGHTTSLHPSYRQVSTS